MKASHKLLLAGLLTLAVAAVVGMFLTGGSPNVQAPTRGRKQVTAAVQAPAVDEQTLATARELAGMAVTPEEQLLARDAARVADHEVDLAFAIALRMASEQSTAETDESRGIRQRIAEIEAQIKAGQARVKQLTAQASSAKESDQGEAQQQVELAQAELALDQDELADAKEDLTRSGGDARSRVQRLLEEHEATEHANGTAQTGPGGQAGTIFSPTSLIAKYLNWSTLRSSQSRLLTAQQDALDEAATFSEDHKALEEHVREGEAQKQALARQPQAAITKSGANRGGRADTLALLLHLSEDEKSLADLDKRIQDLHDLGAIYGQWFGLVKTQQRASLHDVIKSALWIVLAVLAVFILDRLIDNSFTRIALERKQLLTLRAVVRFSVQALAVLLVLLVIFGAPSQVSTVLGLAGAGLTVALKDFVVSFLGWFVLMGRNGIRVGDWVEINGVRGEVIEIGLLRTILLETGNWTEAGHPTGRRVAFQNSFAVEGHYFNFTTSGQWLWDEIRVLIPWGLDPYPIVEQISDVLAKETERSAQIAEEEWQRVTRRYGVKAFDSRPSINERTTDDGVEVVVRYMTRANERSQVRARVNQTAVRLIHQAKAGAVASESPPLPAPTVSGASEAGPDQPGDA